MSLLVTPETDFASGQAANLPLNHCVFTRVYKIIVGIVGYFFALIAAQLL